MHAQASCTAAEAHSAIKPRRAELTEKLIISKGVDGLLVFHPLDKSAAEDPVFLCHGDILAITIGGGLFCRLHLNEVDTVSYVVDENGCPGLKLCAHPECGIQSLTVFDEDNQYFPEGVVHPVTFEVCLRVAG